MSIKPLSQSARWVLAAALAAPLLVATLAAAPSVGGIHQEVAQAHVQFSNGDFVFRGQTIAASGNRNAKKDPINIVFMGHGLYYTNNGVFNHIKAHTGWGGSGPCSSKQRVVWKRGNSSSTTSDKDDFQHDNRSPFTCWRNRWHLRAWDDLEHDRYTANHGRRYRWVIAGVHHETRAPHKIDMDWDVARVAFIKKMAGHCSWPHWKRHPGARLGRRQGQGYPNSGWIGRISLKHTPNC